MNSRCDGALAALVGDGLPVVVHPALCGSHGNKTLQPQEVGRKGILGSRPVGSGSHSGVVYEEAREKSVRAHTHTQTHTHKFTQIPNPSVLLPMLHYCHTSLCSIPEIASSLPPWQPSRCFTQVKLILSGAGWVARAQTGRWEPGFHGMQLISIKIPPLGVIRNKLGWGERQRQPGRRTQRAVRREQG